MSISTPQPGLPVPALPVTLVLGPRFPLLSLAICTECLRVANRELGRVAFAHTIVTESGGPALSASGIEVAAGAALADITRTRVAILLASMNPEAAATPGLVARLRRQDRLGALIGCVDTGSYVLARAGLLRHRHVVVHHEMLPAYAETFGDSVLPDRLFALEGRVVSSVGGAATFDMMLALVARVEDEALADRVAHVLTYRRRSGRLADPALGLDSEVPVGGITDAALARVDRRIARLVEAMQAHIGAPLGLVAICRLAGVEESTARRLFIRRFAMTPGRYYMAMRLDRAHYLLDNSALPVGAIAEKAGFADPSAFARAFRRRFGRLPSQARGGTDGPR